MKDKSSGMALSSGRYRVLSLLRGRECTVNELAGELDLTDNAIRAHLNALQRRGLVRAAGARSGNRKPHVTYVLTEEADRVFPKRYDKVLSALLSVLAGTTSIPGD